MESQALNGNVKVQQAYDVIVIGGGQAGLVAGYYLKETNQNFIILDENSRTGESWRKRWDSLRLFTPSWTDGLPGLPMERQGHYFPSKDEMADYLERYAAQFQLPIRHGARVEKLQRNADGFLITLSGSTLSAKKVIVASGIYRLPRIPEFATQLSPEIQ